MSHLDPLPPLDLNDPVVIDFVNSASVSMMAMLVLGNRAGILGDQLAQQLEEIELRNERLISLNDMNTLLQALAGLVPAGSPGTYALPQDLDGYTAGTPVVGAPVATTDPDGTTTTEDIVLGTGTTDSTRTTTQVVIAAGFSTTTTTVDSFTAGSSAAQYISLKQEIDALALSSGITPVYANKTELDKSIGSIKTNVDSLTQSNQMDMIRLQSLKDKMLLAFEQITALLAADKRSLSAIVQNFA